MHIFLGCCKGCSGCPVKIFFVGPKLAVNLSQNVSTEFEQIWTISICVSLDFINVIVKSTAASLESIEEGDCLNVVSWFIQREFDTPDHSRLPEQLSVNLFTHFPASGAIFSSGRPAEFCASNKRNANCRLTYRKYWPLCTEESLDGRCCTIHRTSPFPAVSVFCYRCIADRANSHFVTVYIYI